MACDVTLQLVTQVGFT